MKYKFDVYVALAMHGRKVGDILVQTFLAKAFCKKYGLSAYFPSEDEGLDKLDRDSLIDSKPDLDKMKWYVSKDDKNLDKCQTLLVLTGDNSSSGTGWEQGRMFYKHKRPIILVAPRMFYGKLTNFTTIKSSYIRPTIEEAVHCIANILRGAPCHTSTKE